LAATSEDTSRARRIAVESDIFTLTEARLAPGPPFPLVIEPAKEEIDAVAWAIAQRRPIRDLLLRHGAILFRGFTGGSVETFRSFIAAVSGEPLPYMEGTSPRHEVGDHIYTSTDYPPHQRIPLHNELSHSNTWPLRLFFHCVVPLASGGATPVARPTLRTRVPLLSTRQGSRLTSVFADDRHIAAAMGFTR
jgi:alpha-ketoglutarate-dependent taurine dioxygenase